MNSYVTSLIRTFVPVGVGALLTWLATTLHVVVDPSSKAGLVALCTSVVAGAYYAVARFLEKRYPDLGVLLGVAAQPTYQTSPDAVDDPVTPPTP